MKRKCSATNRHGEACDLAPIKGGTVCHKHGGSAKQVKDKARERLNALAEPAIVLLGRILRDERVRPGDRIKAAIAVLDRTGYGPSAQVVIDAPWEDVVTSVVAEEGQTARNTSADRYAGRMPADPD